MAKKQAQDKTSIGFEDKIWKAADVLRGNLNAAEYEGVMVTRVVREFTEAEILRIAEVEDDSEPFDSKKCLV